MKSKIELLLPVILTFTLFSGWQSAHANYSAAKAAPSNLVISALLHTEEAIALLRINPDASKAQVELALNLVRDIDKHYMNNTVTSLINEGPTVTATSYLHFYPRLDLSMLNSKRELPTLTKFLETNIIHREETNDELLESNFFFDYTFAKASLITAREALAVNHSLEAMANLERVFEAIYINPEFNVSVDNQ